MPLVKQLYNLFCFCYSYAPASHPGPSGILRTCSPLPLQSTEDLTSRCGSRLVILTGFQQGASIQSFGMFSTSLVIKVTYVLVLRSSLYRTIGMCTYQPPIVRIFTKRRRHRIESCVNRIQNMRTRQKGRGILCWRLLCTVSSIIVLLLNIMGQDMVFIIRGC